MIGIYKITNTKNGKVYIGQSVNIDSRFKQHKKALRDNNHINYRLQDDWNVYGEAVFAFEVLQKCRSIYLDEIEKRTISEYGSTDPTKGYNLSEGVGRSADSPPYYERHIKNYGRITPNESVFFRNDSGEIQYNAVCSRCDKDCKQSFRAEILICPHLKKH